MYKLCLFFLLVAYIVSVVQTTADGETETEWLSYFSGDMAADAARLKREAMPQQIQLTPQVDELRKMEQKRLDEKKYAEKVAENRKILDRIGKRDYLARRMSSHSGN